MSSPWIVDLGRPLRDVWAGRACPRSVGGWFSCSLLLLVGVGLWRLLSASTVVGRCCLAVVCASWLGAGWACGCVSAWFCGTALWLGRPVASSLVAAVRRWFALLVWLGLRVWLPLGGGWCQQGGAVAVAACCSAVVCAAALRLGRPVPGCAASLVAAVRRWFAPPVWLGLRFALQFGGGWRQRGSTVAGTACCLAVVCAEHVEAGSAGGCCSAVVRAAVKAPAALLSTVRERPGHVIRGCGCGCLLFGAGLRSQCLRGRACGPPLASPTSTMGLPLRQVLRARRGC